MPERKMRQRVKRRRSALWLGTVGALLLMLVVACLAAGTHPASQALQALNSPFDARVEKTLERYNIPALSACILRRDAVSGVWELAWSATYGHAMALLPKIAADEDTVFPIGSLTKIFTASAVMQLAEQGRLDLDEDVGAYLGFPVTNPGIEGDTPITVRYLLGHRSGLAATPAEFFTQYEDVGRMEFGVFRDLEELKAYLAREEAWAHMDAAHPGVRAYYRPGERFCYSNVGYLVLGFIIEEVINRGQPAPERLTWKDQVQTHILDPLGLRHTVFTWADVPHNRNKAQGYIEKRFIRAGVSGKTGEPLLVPQNPPVRNLTIGILYNAGGAAGQMLGTAKDLADFFIVHLNQGQGYARDSMGRRRCLADGRPVPVRILAPQSVSAMHTLEIETYPPADEDPGLVVVCGYGLGWARLLMGGRYWNSPWGGGREALLGVDWGLLEGSGIRKGGFLGREGLVVEGHNGALPGYASGMFRVSENLALVYLMNENFSEEDRDESRMQPLRFRHYQSAADDGPALRGYDGALPHNQVKYSEVAYLLLQKAASLK